MSQLKENPAASTTLSPTEVMERDIVPMSVPMRKLEINEIAGYHLHWMRGTPARLAQAQRAGYTFVDEDEVMVTSTLLGGDAKTSGSTDMGTRVSLISGEAVDGSGQAERLYLMKVKQEHFEKGQKILEDRNEQVAQALRGGSLGGERDTEAHQRYVDSKRTTPNLFTRKT